MRGRQILKVHDVWLPSVAIVLPSPGFAHCPTPSRGEGPPRVLQLVQNAHAQLVTKQQKRTLDNARHSLDPVHLIASCCVNLFTDREIACSESRNKRRAILPDNIRPICATLPKSTRPFHPASARCGDVSSCRFTDLRTASVPAFHPAETF